MLAGSGAKRTLVGTTVPTLTLKLTLVTRGALWEASETPANPGVTRMTGEQLLELLERGNEPSFQNATPRPLRGRPMGRLELAGATPEAGREYVVASTDWELGVFSGYVPEGWELQIEYEFPLIVREAIEEHLRGRS